MSAPSAPKPCALSSGDEAAIRSLYTLLLEGWKSRSGERFAAPFAPGGEIIGFDGSHHVGQAGIAKDVQGIFDQHSTGSFVGKIRGVRLISSDVAVLRAVSSVVPAGQTDLMPETNSIQTLVAVKREGEWVIEEFLNTPAQYHGRPELRDALTEELRQLL